MRRSPSRTNASKDLGSHASTASSSVPETRANQFEGDYFGPANTYMEEDFPFPEDHDEVRREAGAAEDEEHEGDDSDSDVEDHKGAEHVWEPVRPHPPPPGSPMNVDSDPDTSSASANPNAPAHNGQENIREAPSHIDHFGGQAGAPITNATQNSGYNAYAQTVDKSQTNPWAPFASQVDWEVARWAKLRGSGSTAFSDLLAIEGVCSCILSCISQQY